MEWFDGIKKYLKVIGYFCLILFLLRTFFTGMLFGAPIYYTVIGPYFVMLGLAGSVKGFTSSVKVFLGIEEEQDHKKIDFVEMLDERKRLKNDIDREMARLVSVLGMKYDSLPKAAIDKYMHLEVLYDGKQYSRKMLDDIIELADKIERFEGKAKTKDYSKGYSYGNEGTGYSGGSGSSSANRDSAGRTKASGGYANPTVSIIAEYSYFRDCNDLAEVKKKYHQLSKKYHPDNPSTGNEAIFMEMDGQYTELSGRIS